MAQWKFLHVETPDSAVWCCCCVTTKSNHQQSKVFFQPVKRYKAQGCAHKWMKPSDDMTMLAFWSLFFTSSILNYRYHCCTKYRKLYRFCNSYTCYYFRAKFYSSSYEQQKNAVIETIFFAALAVHHPAIFHTNITKKMQKCILLPCVFIYNYMNVKNCLWRQWCQINKWY